MALDLENTVVPQSRSYQMDPLLFAGFLRGMIMRLVLFGPVIIAVIWFLDGRVSPRRNVFDFIFLPFILAVVGYQSIKRERAKWDSLLLEFRDGSLVRKLSDYPALEVSPSEVATITESSHGITIRIDSRLKTLFVNAGLLDYEDFRRQVVAWAPGKMVPSTTSVRSLLGAAAAILWCASIVGGPLYLIHTPHRELVLPLGLGLTVGMAATILYNWRSPNSPISIRYTVWILLLLPLMAMCLRLY